jgi:hypothetical protein
MQASRELNRLPVSSSVVPLLSRPRTSDKENAAVSSMLEANAVWGFDSELIDPALKDIYSSTDPSIAVLAVPVSPRPIPDLASNNNSLPTFIPASHSTPNRHLPACDLSISSSTLVMETSPPTATGAASSTITSVPSLGEHPIHHLRRVLYEFNSAFPGGGIICVINALLNLPLPSMTRFYRGEHATSDGNCPFCEKNFQ